MRIDVPSGLQLVLLFLYLVLAEISLIQLFRLIYNRHKLLSFQFWFLFISLIWCGERAFTFAFSPLLTQAQLSFLWIIPAAFQFISFSLLVLYSRFLLNQHRWSQQRFWSLFVYFIVNLTLVSITFSLAYFTATTHQSSESTRLLLRRFHSGWFAIQFSLLLVLYAYYGYKLRQFNNNTTLNKQQSTLTQFWISVIAWVIFFTQWLYYVLSSISMKKFALRIETSEDQILDIPFPIFLILTIWEILPTALVLYVSRQIPTSERTIITDIKKYGLFFCCKTNNYDFSDGLDPNALLFNTNFNTDDNNANNTVQQSSIFSQSSQFYPHQASYQVITDTDQDHQYQHPQYQHHGVDDDDVVGHHQQYDDISYLTNFNQENGLLQPNTNGIDTTNMSIQQLRQQQQHLQQYQHQGGTSSTNINQFQPGSRQQQQQHSSSSLNGPHSTSQIMQLQIQSQLSQHLARYGNNGDDGGDLF